MTIRQRTMTLCLAAAAAGAGVASGCSGEEGDAGGPLSDASTVTPADSAADVPDADGPPETAPPADAAGSTDVAAGQDAARSPDAALAPAPDARPRFRFGIAAADRDKMMPSPIFHVDHDPVEHPNARATCTNFEGEHFPFCYDGHRGSDFMLGGGFSTMDNGSAEIVAAAGGVVEVAQDGHYDRCRGNVSTLDVTCDGHEMRPNYVKVRHANGWSSLYYHMKRDSVAVVVGQRVQCGERLGLVGSSGNSTLPHLHFQVEDQAGDVFDPFAGPEHPGESLFVEQDTSDRLPGGECDPAWAAPPSP